AMAENLVCPWPDCNVPANRCQVHHIDAHNNGGHTKPSNLTMLCKYHNGVNDDDGPRKERKGPTRGRMRRHRGKARLHTPAGKVLGSRRDRRSMGAMDGIYDAAAAESPAHEGPQLRAGPGWGDGRSAFNRVQKSRDPGGYVLSGARAVCLSR